MQLQSNWRLAIAILVSLRASSGQVDDPKVLPPSDNARLIVHVIDEARESVPGCKVIARDIETKKPISSEASTGIATLSLKPRKYEVSVSCKDEDGEAKNSNAHAVMLSARSLSVIYIEAIDDASTNDFGGAAALRIKVVDTRGQPIERASVEVKSEHKTILDSSEDESEDCYTDESGLCLFPFLIWGPWKIKAGLEGYRDSAIYPVNLAPQTETLVTVTLASEHPTIPTRGGRVTVITTASEGAPPPGTVTISGSNYTATLIPRASNHYSLGSIPPGTYSLSVKATGFTTIEQRGVTVSLGKTTYAAFPVQPGNETRFPDPSSDGVVAVNVKDATGRPISTGSVVSLEVDGKMVGCSLARHSKIFCGPVAPGTHKVRVMYGDLAHARERAVKASGFSDVIVPAKDSSKEVTLSFQKSAGTPSK